LALAYTTYVMRVGGDFMFARLLIPVTPFYALALEAGLGPLLARRRSTRRIRAAGAGLGACALLAVAFAASPLGAARWVRGIVDERESYQRADRARAVRCAEE